MLARLAQKAGPWLTVAGLVTLAYYAMTWLGARKIEYTGVRVGVVCHRMDPPVFPNMKARDPSHKKLAEEMRGYPVYFVEISIYNTPQVDGLHLRLAGPAAAGWYVTSSAFANANEVYGAKLPGMGFPTGPDGFVALPGLPTLAPNGATTIRGIIYSRDDDMCNTDWVAVGHDTIRPVMLSENQRNVTYFIISNNALRNGVTALVGLLTVAFFQRRHLREALRAFRASRSVAAAAKEPFRPKD